MLQESSQKLSKIHFGGCLEAISEPPLCIGDPELWFLMILGYFGTPFGDQFSVILGIIFSSFSEMASTWRFRWICCLQGTPITWKTMKIAVLSFKNEDRQKDIRHRIRRSPSLILHILGFLWETFLVTSWTPFRHRFSEDLRDSAKVKAPPNVNRDGDVPIFGVQLTTITQGK